MAKHVFDMLLNEFRTQGLADIGTFMIDEIQKEFEYEIFDESYEYTDTEKTIFRYELLSIQPEGAKIALKKLLDASIQYFSLVYNIPDRFNKLLSEINNERVNVRINFNTITERQENIDEVLKEESVFELITLLQKARENFNLDDDTFLESILN